MATNGIKRIASSSTAAVLSQVEFEALPDRTSGFPTGILPRHKLNKVLKQTSLIAEAFAQVIVDAGVSVDDGQLPSTLAAAFTAALLASVPTTLANTLATVNTVAALRALSSTTNTQVFVLGYYAPGDGGGGPYRFDATDTTSTDNGGTTLVASDGARWKLSLTGTVSVRQFGAKGDGTTDDTVPFTNAMTLVRDAYAPAGTYRVGITQDVPFRLRGAGSQLTILKPLSTTMACIVYRAAAPFWTYHSVVDGVGFDGLAPRSMSGGCGFSFGATSYGQYSPGLEFANNVSFRNCRFTNLFKGVHFPFGNIGTEFYSCGWTSNYFGVYSSNNKWVGTTAFPTAALMHAGNKYFYAGQMDNNVCAIYIHNTALGFGGVVVTGTILEYNDVAVYLYTTNTAGHAVVLSDAWNEANGQATGVSTATLDSWSWSVSGPVPANMTLPSRSLIFEASTGLGESVRVEQRGGFLTDVWLRGPSVCYVASAVRHESSAGFGGRDCTIDSPTSSCLLIDDVETAGGVSTVAGVVVRRGLRPTVHAIGDYSFAQGRGALVPMRSSRISGGLGGAYLSLPLTTAATITSSVTVTNSTASDGRIYAVCNSSSATFTAAGQVANIGGSTFAIPAGKWCVVTVDVKPTAGDLSICYWDASTNRLTAFVKPPLGRWTTVGAIGLNTLGVSASMFLTVYANTAGASAWRLSALQVVTFDTREEAESFLDSRVFVS